MAAVCPTVTYVCVLDKSVRPVSAEYIHTKYSVRERNLDFIFYFNEYLSCHLIIMYSGIHRNLCYSVLVKLCEELVI